MFKKGRFLSSFRKVSKTITIIYHYVNIDVPFGPFFSYACVPCHCSTASGSHLKTNSIHNQY